LQPTESIRIYDGVSPPPGDDIHFGYAIPTIIDELVMPPVIFADGEWAEKPPLSGGEDYWFEPPVGGEWAEKPPLSGGEDYWFEPPVGLLHCHLSLHSEVATLPLTFRSKGLRECVFKINYWGMSPNAFAKVKLLADLGFANPEPVDEKHGSVSPREVLVTLLAEEIVTEVKGVRDGQPLHYRIGTLTATGSLPTGVAPSIAAQWLASGRIDKPGVYAPEAIVDPVPLR